MVEDIIIITGKINSGKSSRARTFANGLLKKGNSAGGVVTVPFWRGEKKSYYIFDLMTGESRLFASEEPVVPSIRYKRFYFSAYAFPFAEEAAERASGADFLFIDEPGPLELEGRGFASLIDRTIRDFSGTLVLVVRENITEEITRRFSLPADLIRIYPPEKKLPL